MLKSCWDCLVGYSREQADNEVVYGTQLNGHSVSAPPWPEARDDKEIMFILPRRLNYNDQITISGTIVNNSRQFSVNLLTGNSSPDFNNIACQIKATFPSEESGYEDKLTVTIIKDGYEVFSEDPEDKTATSLFAGGRFDIKIIIRDGNVADIYNGSFPILECQMLHNLSDIRFLTLEGDIKNVNKLDFEFGN